VGWRWSRGRLDGEVYADGVGVHAGGRPPRLRLLVPSWFTSSSLRRGAASSLACRRRPGGVVVHAGDPLPQLRSGSRLLPCPARRGGGALPPSSNPAQTEAVESGKPQRGWWLGVRASPAWRPFETRPQAARGGIAPRTPGRSQGGAGGARGRRSVSPQMRAVRGSRVFTSPAVDSDPARTHRPSACGPPGWRGRPIARHCAMRLG
jgi:hypothetical protein